MSGSRAALLLPFAALLVIAAGAGARPAAAAETPVLRIRAAADTLTPDEAGLWQLDLEIENRLGVGLYLDSLLFEVHDDGPGVTRLDPVTRQNMTRLAAAFSPTSAGEKSTFALTPFASCEHGRLQFDWFGHGADKSVWHVTAGIPVSGGPIADSHPSRFVTAAGRRIELVEFPPPAGAAYATGVLLVHGHGSHARSQLRMADRLAAEGFGVVLVSQPGYGQSQGPPDYMGPATVAALDAGFEALRRMPGVDRERLVVWGVARGATAALLLAERRPRDIAAVVAVGGLYDLSDWLATTPPSAAREDVLAEAGSTPAAWAARSPLRAAGTIRGNVLLVHGRTDDTAPIAQARALAAALRAGGAQVDTLYFPGGRLLPRGAVAKVATDFISRLSTQ